MEGKQQVNSSVYSQGNFNIQSVFEDSNILKDHASIQKMSNMLQELNPIIKCQRIFRATQDGLLMQNFHQKCDYKPNLLFLVQNEYGFIYGGYSPCPMDYKNRYGQWQTDHSMRSFVFSLNANLRAKVVQKERTISNGQVLFMAGHLVQFGEYPYSLVIGANTIKRPGANWVKFCSVKSENEQVDAGSYERFEEPPSRMECLGFDLHPKHGNSCRLREVEVYQIVLGGQEQKQK